MRFFSWLRRRPTYRAVIVGQETGNRMPLNFVTFRNLEKAMAWCLRMNLGQEELDGELAYFDWERIP